MKAKLRGYIAPYRQTLNRFPNADASLPAHYARAFAWHKAGYPEKAEADVGSLIAAQPDDPYFLEIKGRILFEAGKPREALAPLREAVARSDDAPLIATTLGHALIASENPTTYADAIRVLRLAFARDENNPFAWYQLGTVYELTGDRLHALLATAEQASLNGDPRMGAYDARLTMAGLPRNSADWVRAQDLAVAAQHEMDDDPGQYKQR